MSGIRNEFSYKDIFQKDFSYKCQFCTKVCHLQGWSLKFQQNVRCSNQSIERRCENKLKITKVRFVFEQYRQTSQRMMNVRKKQFKSFEISAEKISFQIMSSCFQFWILLLLALKSITQGVTMWMVQKAFRSSITIAISFYT